MLFFQLDFNLRKNNVVNKKIKNLPIRNLSLNVKFQATYTTKLEFCTFYYIKEK